MGSIAKFLAGGFTVVAVVGTVIIFKLISEAGKTLRSELRDIAEPDAK